MKTRLNQTLFSSLRTVVVLAVSLGVAQVASAANVIWTGASSPNQNWSSSGNWSGGTPSGNAVTFPANVFPASTNAQGVVNNIVDSSTTITGLTYANTNGTANQFDTTFIPSGVTLTVNGTVTVGTNNWTTIAGMSGTGTFVVNNTAGNFNIEGNSATAQTATFTLADGSNFVNVATLSIGETGGNNGRQAILNLGGGTNLIYANTINLGTGKGSATVQFTNTTGGISIRNAAGTGRATIFMGNGNSGSGACNGKLLLAGHPADVLAGTVTISAGSGGDTGAQQGTVTFDSGTFDANAILMASSSSASIASTTGTLTVGGSASAANFTVGTGGFTLSGTSGGKPGTGIFTLSNNATATINSSISKAAAANNTGTINVNSASLVMASGTVIGTPAIPIDTVNVNGATIQLAVLNGVTNIAATTFNDSGVASTVNISSLPVISGYPTTFPLIKFTTLSGGMNLNLGTLPGTYTGYVTNDSATTISLVIVGGPAVPKPVVWQGNVNSDWETSALNWTNSAGT